MNREAFEQLVSEWLDARAREDLRKRVEAVCGFDATLAKLRDQYVRLDDAVRALREIAPAVDWERWRQRVSAEIRRPQRADATGASTSHAEAPILHPEVSVRHAEGQSAGDPTDQSRDREGAREFSHPQTSDSDAIDAALAGLAGIDERVDWSRLQGRISAAVDRAARREQRGFTRLRPLLYAASVVTAAAAVLLLAFWLPDSPLKRVTPLPQTRTGFVRVVVHGVSETTTTTSGFVRVSIPAQEPIEMNVEQDVPADDEPEIFLMVEPPDGLLAMAPATDGWR